MLRRHLRDGKQHQVADISDLQIEPDLSTVEVPVRILAREDKKLRTKVIPLVKVQWSRQGVEEASWEREEDIRRDYPHLFEDQV